MQIVSNLFLLVCTGLAALLFVFASDMQRLAGPDQGGAEIQFLMLAIPRWLLLSIVLGGLIARGAFEWVNPSRQVL